MKAITLMWVMISASTTLFAQTELGFAGGVGLLNNVSASGSLAGSATAGFAPGFVAGVFVADRFRRWEHLAGEVRYEYMRSNLRLSMGGQSPQFDGSAHAIHYDFLYYVNPWESRVRFFALLGGGVKVFLGTGAEAAYQPLNQFGYFTRTSQIMPMITAGAGVKFRLGSNWFLRGEVRDFVTGFPTAVLTPAPGVKFGSLLHDIVPMVSLIYVK